MGLLSLPFTLIEALFTFIQTDKIFLLKYIVTYLYLRASNYFAKKRFEIYDINAKNDPYKLGYLSNPIEKYLEQPCGDAHMQNGADEIYFYGTNSRKESLIVRISRGCYQQADAWLYLTLSNGKSYTLPRQESRKISSEDPQTFVAGGLKIRFLSPMRRWRIFFNGMLKEINSEESEKLVHVKFSFVWTASSPVFDYMHDMDPHLLATALASVKWKKPFIPAARFSEIANSYEQCGMFLGTVTVENSEEHEIYLWGLRTRTLGEIKDIESRKFWHIYGVVKTGSIFHIGEFNIPGLVEGLKFGFLMRSNGSVYPIKSLNISSTPGNENEKHLIKFSAGLYDCILKTECSNKSVNCNSTQGWGGEVTLMHVPFTLEDYSGRGVVIAGNLRKLQLPKLRPKVIFKASPLPFVVSLNEPQCQLVELTGGKGASLGQLTEISNTDKKFLVPQGIVITTAAFQEFMRGHLNDVASNVENVAWGKVNGNLQEECKKAVSYVSKAYIPDSVYHNIERSLIGLGGKSLNSMRFAVRSSATGEDSAMMSCAGQMDTFLGIQGLKEILSSIKKCWASQFSFISVEYKRRYGQLINSPMAVVVQEMVPCDSAGVLFTCDPLTCNPSIITISGSYGLGESVVSASVDPDTVVLKREINDDLSVLSTTLGQKKTKIVINTSGGTTEETVTEEDVKKCSLSEEQALSLGKIAILVEEKYCSSRDIEWGMVGNQVYLLQARPLTFVDKESDFEIKHELDTFIRQEEEYSTKENVGEVMPGATPGLSLSWLWRGFEICIMKKNMKVNATIDPKAAGCPYFSKGNVGAQSHTLLNVIDLISQLAGVGDQHMAKSFMVGLFGKILDDPRIFEISNERYREKPKNSILPLIYKMKDMFFARNHLNASIKQLGDFSFDYENCSTASELFHEILSHCSDNEEAMFALLNCSSSTTVWNFTLLSIIASAKGDFSEDAYSAFSQLLSSCKDVESADVPATLQSLACSISKNEAVESFKQMSVENAYEWLQKSPSEAGIKYRDFLLKHGHRCIKEFDIRSKPWGENPLPLVKMLQSLVKNVSTEVKKKKDINIAEIFNKCQIPLSWKNKCIIKLMLPFCESAVGSREASKSLMIKTIHMFRKSFRHLAQLMVQEGRLYDADLLYFMVPDEIEELLQTRCPRLMAKVIRRKNVYSELDSLRFPEMIIGIPKPITRQIVNGSENGAVTTMKGVPVSQGVIKGPARVLQSLSECDSIQKGDILITYSTDIGWTPYFTLLSGVVTEIGGLISHGAVVAREYGLPCIVGVPGATLVFKSGDTVILNGNTGVLQKVEES